MDDKNFISIPGEAFTAAGNVANNLIDKVSNAIGYAFIPKGKWKDYEDAVSFLVDEIKKNDSMPTMAKAALISKVRVVLNQYINQNDILEIAMNNLSNNACPENLDDDWLMFFMDKAKNIKNEDIKLIFGKILAGECNIKGSASKALINILSIMDNESAESFRKICKYAVKLCYEDNQDETTLFITSLHDLKEHHIKISLDDIMNLSSLGLIEYVTFSNYLSSAEKAELKYGNTILKLEKSGGIPIGCVGFTRVGLELVNNIVIENDDEYLSEIEEYLRQNNVSIESIEN